MASCCTSTWPARRPTTWASRRSGSRSTTSDTEQVPPGEQHAGAAFATRTATLGTPNGTSTTFTLPVDLPQGGDWNITAYAYDTVDQQDTSTSGATARYRIYPGDVPPTLTDALLAPTEGATFTDGRILVSGRAEDDQAMQNVQVSIMNSANQYLGSNGTFTEHHAELAYGVPDQPRHAWVELLLHHADRARGRLHGAASGEPTTTTRRPRFRRCAT